MGQCTSAPSVHYKAQSLEQRSEYENALRAVREDGMNLEYAGELRRDALIVKEATLENSDAFKFASDALRHDPILIMDLLERTKGRVYSHVLLDDMVVDLKAATLFGLNLKYMGEASRANKDISTAAVISNGSALEFASDSLRDDKDLVWLSIDSISGGFKFASERLRSDPETIKHALSVGDFNVEFVHPDSMDERLILDVMSRYGHGYKYLPDRLKVVKPIAMAALANCCSAYLWFPHPLNDDDEVVKIVLETTSLFYPYLPERYKTKEEAIRSILSKHSCVEDFSEEIKSDPAVLALAIKHSRLTPGYEAHGWRELFDNPIRFFSPEILEENLTEELAVEAVTRNFYAYKYLPQKFKDSAKIQKMAMTHWKALKILPKTADMCLLAVTMSLEALPEVPGSVRRELYKAYLFQAELRPPCKAFLWGATHRVRESCAEKKRAVEQIPLQKLNNHGIHFGKLLKKAILSYVGIEYYIHATVGKALAVIPAAIEIVDNEVDLTGDSDEEQEQEMEDVGLGVFDAGFA